MADVTIVVHSVALERLLLGPAGPVARDALRRGNNVRDLARRIVGRDSGRLAASIVVRLRTGGRGLAVEVGSSLDYARYHHDGTGIYGPRRRSITVRRGHVMVFEGLAGETVFARTVSGSPGTRYLERALPAARL